MIITGKGFGVVNKAEIDVFLELSCFLMIQQMLANWSLVPLPFLKPAWTSEALLREFWVLFSYSMRRVQLCGILSILCHGLWDWNEDWHFPVLWLLLCFPNLLTYWVQHFHIIVFQDLKNSTGIPSPLLALFTMMCPKAHLTLHSRMSGSRWWLHHCDYLDHEDLFYTVLLYILATSS